MSRTLSSSLTTLSYAKIFFSHQGQSSLTWTLRQGGVTSDRLSSFQACHEARHFCRPPTRPQPWDSPSALKGSPSVDLLVPGSLHRHCSRRFSSRSGDTALAEQLLEGYLKLRAGGKHLSPETESKLAQQLAAQADALHKQYGVLHLHTFNAQSADMLPVKVTALDKH
jgi:hypothetical protein